MDKKYHVGRKGMNLPCGRAAEPGSRRMNEIIENRWLSVDEIATYLGVKRDTIY